MDNPWAGLQEYGELILPIDVPAVDDHDSRLTAYADRHLRFVRDLLPEPFLGRPDGRVVLLSLDPGLRDDDTTAGADADVVAAMRSMLRQEPMDWPMCWLNPAFSWASRATWWRDRLGPLAAATSWETLGRDLLVVNMYGYHAERFRKPRLPLPSVEYSAGLARSAISRGAPIVTMRGGSQWRRLVPELSDYEHGHALKNPQAPYLSPANAPGFFAELVAALS